MLLLLSFSLIPLMILFLILSLNFLISMKMMKNREKMSPFECGFDPLSNSRLPFSIQFFLISLIFLIFDIEISLLIPLPCLLLYFNKMTLLMSSLFLIILIFSLLMEYLEQSIDWKI